MGEEKLYVIKCGKGYVRFNLDGSMIGCRRSNSIATISHLNKLPFNIPLAEASGIIEIVELEKTPGDIKPIY